MAGRAASPPHRRYAPGDNRVDITLEDGPTLSLWWVTRSEWDGLIDVAGLETEALYGWFDRRPFDDYEPRVRLGRAQAGVMGLYDEIAAFYDPWSRSVTEDVGFYVDEALASGGPVVELAVGTGRIAVPIARAGIDVIGVDSSPGDARRRAGGRRRGRRRRAASTSASATCASRRWPSASRSSSARSARSCTWRPRTRSCARCAPPAPLLEPGGRFVFDVFSPSREDIEETDGRWLEREPGIFERADWDEGARTLTLSVRSDGSVTSFGLHWLSVAEWLRLLDDAGFAVETGLRLVRPAPARGRRGHDLRHARDVDRVPGP